MDLEKEAGHVVSMGPQQGVEHHSPCRYTPSLQMLYQRLHETPKKVGRASLGGSISEAEARVT